MRQGGVRREGGAGIARSAHQRAQQDTGALSSASAQQHVEQPEQPEQPCIAGTTHGDPAAGACKAECSPQPGLRPCYVAHACCHQSKTPHQSATRISAPAHLGMMTTTSLPSFSGRLATSIAACKGTRQGEPEVCMVAGHGRMQRNCCLSAEVFASAGRVQAVDARRPDCQLVDLPMPTAHSCAHLHCRARGDAHKQTFLLG